MEKQDIRAQVRGLEKERIKILKKVLHPQCMIAGGLIKRWTKCGKPYCRCQRGELHGPYYYLSRLEQGKPRTLYLGQGGRPAVRFLQRYQVFQRSVARLNAINREIVKLLWALAADKIEVFKMRKGDQV